MNKYLTKIGTGKKIICSLMQWRISCYFKELFFQASSWSINIKSYLMHILQMKMLIFKWKCFKTTVFVLIHGLLICMSSLPNFEILQGKFWCLPKINTLFFKMSLLIEHIVITFMCSYVQSIVLCVPFPLSFIFILFLYCLIFTPLLLLVPFNPKFGNLLANSFWWLSNLNILALFMWKVDDFSSKCDWT